MSDKNKFIFGPILSRRLGSSLGIDPIPFKTCSLDCVYCECGKTTVKTNEQDDYIVIDEIIDELKFYLDNNPPHIDIITLAGSGEPTLNKHLGKLVRFIKDNYPQYKIGILTNSSLLTEPEVREYLLLLDFVLPSIDAMLDSSFIKVNRPAKTLKCSDIIDGIRAFAKEFTGQLWVEYFILPGVNDSDEELELFKKFFEEIKPTRVQLNSMDRPGTCDWVEAPSVDRLKEIERYFRPLPVEIVSRKAKDMVIDKPSVKDIDNMIFAIKRRPLTVEDLSTIYSMSINEADSLTGSLVDDGVLEVTYLNGLKYFKVVS